MGNDSKKLEIEREGFGKICEKLTTREFFGLTSGRSVPFILK